MTILVVDVETTGLTAADNSIVEIAFVTMTNTGKIQDAFSWLVKPSHPISFPAMATHHITEDMVINAPTLTEVMLRASKHFAPMKGVCYAAHNAEFDSSFLPALSPWLCTWRCALHLWPEAPGHSNSVLRYWLPGLNDERNIYSEVWPDHSRACKLPPHRALPDAWTTAFILRRMLQVHSLKVLQKLSTQPVLLHTCRFGKYFGKPWAEVPKVFCEWIIGRGARRHDPEGGRDIGFDMDVLHTAKHYLTEKEDQK